MTSSRQAGTMGPPHDGIAPWVKLRIDYPKTSGSRNVSGADIKGAAATSNPDGDDDAPQRASEQATEIAAPPAELVPVFHALYREHFDFVFRNLRRLGVPPGNVDDAVQDVFIVVLRQLHKLEPGSHPKAWLFAIALRVARNHRRRQRRKEGQATLVDTHELRASDEHDPYEGALKSDAARFVHRFLDTIDEDKRSVFVMAELEQMTAPEIASALGVNLNTIYGRIRAARREFELAVSALREGNDGER